MKIKDIRKMTIEELEEQVVILKKNLFHTKIQVELAKSKNSARISQITKVIARIKTVINERKLGIEKVPVQEVSSTNV
ncbi:50S ribosomal protein L29 ['Camptotheca acuminata' phytoplasma]|uniref:50S ribosomal protein L29 n=1 Tax='Camptotheca acuminata' phytoplasma TaxID=3239192 RepID=UPI00351A7356